MPRAEARGSLLLNICGRLHTCYAFSNRFVWSIRPLGGIDIFNQIAKFAVSLNCRANLPCDNEDNNETIKKDVQARL